MYIYIFQMLLGFYLLMETISVYIYLPDVVRVLSTDGNNSLPDVVRVLSTDGNNKCIYIFQMLLGFYLLHG